MRFRPGFCLLAAAMIAAHRAMGMETKLTVQ
jgi:hypothetical protein